MLVEITDAVLSCVTCLRVTVLRLKHRVPGHIATALFQSTAPVQRCCRGPVLAELNQLAAPLSCSAFTALLFLLCFSALLLRLNDTLYCSTINGALCAICCLDTPSLILMVT